MRNVKKCFSSSASFKRKSVEGVINNYQLSEKCRGLCPGPDSQDLINYL